MANKICKWCKTKEIELSYGEDLNTRLREQESCFTCDYFMQKANLIIAGHRYIKVKGNLYAVGDEGKTPYFGQRGFGGASWIIHLLGTDIYFESTNLWDNSVGPEWFQKWMPDNAEFLHSSMTFPGMWDCECSEDFHHYKSEARCQRCKATRGNQPDSIWKEVTPEEKAVLAMSAFAYLSKVKRKLPIAK